MADPGIADISQESMQNLYHQQKISKKKQLSIKNIIEIITIEKHIKNL